MEMEPLSLQVHGMRPWKRPTTIGFLAGEPRTVSASDGPADEAAIKQAIAYAFGQMPCGDRGVRALMNEDARRMSVSLIFWAHDGAWCVRRRARRLPDGAVVDAGCMLKRIGGETIQDVRRVRPAATRGTTSSQSRTADDIAWTCACMVAVNREVAAERRDAAMLADAQAAAALDTADRRQMLTALVERSVALRKTMARKQAAIERLLNTLLELRRG